MTAERLPFSAASDAVFGRPSANLPATHTRTPWTRTVKPATVRTSPSPGSHPPRTALLAFDPGPTSLYQSVPPRSLEAVRSPTSKVPEMAPWASDSFKKRFPPRGLLFRFHLCNSSHQTASQRLLWKVPVHPRYTGPGA